LHAENQLKQEKTTLTQQPQIGRQPYYYKCCYVAKSKMKLSRIFIKLARWAFRHRESW